MSDAPARPMKYPYTISAKIAQFPMKYYVQNQWIWRYWMAGILVSAPIFYKIHKLANSPENVKIWAENKRKEEASHH
ncbi:hypothetical protein JYU34_018388 [Plutella xylostella]|uniref:Uncharacterized protein n=2 Tax=Plutella xylostella TaxID=51655 RepID=A0ABQ7PXF8_PLUXY|nr:uncharacterized protein LOC105393335 [Plutella xylostella]XP_011563376.1 uncharacterized protein LOC105393335 [Plutella xylostella]KAG7297672.1 hypothetical protein JYU34_018388 [Plutella xylostella]CAG9128079.1 unnamed protein product [Plutella xylostella]